MTEGHNYSSLASNFLKNQLQNKAFQAPVVPGNDWGRQMDDS